MNIVKKQSISFMDFLERADSIQKKGLLIRKSETIPPLSESHIFHLGDDEEVTRICTELRDDLAKDITTRVPLPFDDTTMVSVISDGWVMDRVFDLGFGPFEVPKNAFLETRDPNVPEAEAKRLLAELLSRQRAQFFNVVRIEEHVDFATMWTVAYHGSTGGAFSFTALEEHEYVYGYETASKSPHYTGLQEMVNTNVSEIIRQTALISHPSNYYVKVEPKLSPREKRRETRGEPRPIRKAPHFIVVDHEQLCELNRKHGGGTHASPVPHHRRGHWRRVADCFLNAKLRGERLWVRPTYVGETQFEDEKAIYNVLMDWKKPE